MSLNSAAIPQADRVERALEYAVLTWHRELALRDLLFHGRDALYYRSAAQALGLVDAWGQPSERMAEFCGGEQDPIELLRGCFHECTVGQAWAQWARASLWQVDADSAEEFLAATTNLSHSTVARRAKSLRAWLEALRPEQVEDAPPIERLRGQLLNCPVHRFDLSNRTFNVFRRERITVVREAVALGREGLLALWAFGPGCAREFDAALREQPPGEGLDELHHALLAGDVDTEAPAELPPTATTPTAAEALGFDPTGFSDIVQLWQAMVGRLSEREQLVVTRRCGSLGTVETLTQLGQALELSRERIRQIQSRALEQLREAPGWLEEIRERLAGLQGSASSLWLSQLEHDPWFAPLTERPELLRFLSRRFLEPQWVCYRWDDGVVLTRKRAREPQELLQAVRERASAHAWPGPIAQLEALVADALRGSDSEDLRDLLLEQVRAQAIFDDEAQPTRVLGFGSSRDASIRAMLARSLEPVAVAEIQRRLGRGRIPSECIYVRRGFVTLPDHFEGFDRWQERLVPEVERSMRGEDPGLQWMAADLFSALAQSSRLPEWLTPMVLAGMLRRSERFDDLGRQRFALQGSGSGERVQLLPAVVEILEREGEPMAEEAVFEALGRRTKVLPGTALLLRTVVPVFPVGDGRLGLVERDLPGGSAAIREASELLETELRARGRGLTSFQALELVRPLSQTHAAWTESMIGVIPRMSAVLVSNRSGIGLETWDDCRITTNADLLRDLLDEGDGATTVALLQARIVELHGKPAVRGTLAGTANSIGAKVRGEWIRSREIDESPPSAEVPEVLASPAVEPVVIPARPAHAPHAAAIELPSASDLGVPRASRQLFNKLTHESVGDWDALLDRCARHAAEFETRLATNEFLPVQDARNILAGLRIFVARVLESGDPLAQRLAWIFGRYFEIDADGELDFAIGGLDDDLELFNALTSHLGMDELAIAFS